MALRNIKNTEHFGFTDAHSLLVWLQQFKETDLHAVTFEHGVNDYLQFIWEEEILSDNSTAFNIRVPITCDTTD